MCILATTLTKISLYHLLLRLCSYYLSFGLHSENQITQGTTNSLTLHKIAGSLRKRFSYFTEWYHLLE